MWYKSSMIDKVKDTIFIGDIPLRDAIRGKDLRDYKIAPDFIFKERIIGNIKESGKTDINKELIDSQSTLLVI